MIRARGGSPGFTLAGDDDANGERRQRHLEVLDTPSPADAEQKQIEDRLFAELHAPRSRAQLRQALCVRNERLGHLLEQLAAQGRIVHADHLWRVPFPWPHLWNGTPLHRQGLGTDRSA